MANRGHRSIRPVDVADGKLIGKGQTTHRGNERKQTAERHARL